MGVNHVPQCKADASALCEKSDEKGYIAQAFERNERWYDTPQIRVERALRRAKQSNLAQISTDTVCVLVFRQRWTQGVSGRPRAQRQKVVSASDLVLLYYEVTL